MHQTEGAPRPSRSRDRILTLGNEPFYSPCYKPPPEVPPSPAEPVWTLQKNGHRVDCVLKFHGESYGWECPPGYSI